jgi:hypothetical protein
VRFTATAADGLATVTEVPLDGTGTATLSTSSLGVGDHTMLAEYVPTGSFDASSDLVDHTVGLRPTSTLVSADPATVLVGEAITVNAIVFTTGAATGIPTGSVTFTVTDPAGVPTVSTVPLDNGGVATYTATAAASGLHSVTAEYVPTGVFAASSGTLSQTVSGRPTTTTLTSSRNPSTYGQSVTLTAAVRSVTASNGVPTGSVQFVITNPSGPASYVTVVLNRQGTASYTTSGLVAGTHRVTATFVPSGTLGFEASTATRSQVVNRGASTVTIAASNTRPRRGQSVTLTARIAPTTATGTVQFTVNGARLGAPVRVIGGRATLTTSALPAGTLAVRAVYSGDANLFGATSSPMGMRVR